MTGNAPPNELRNLGPKSRIWLAEIGIHSIGDVRQLGAVETYRRLKAANGRVSLNLLYALHAALENRDWREVTLDEKEMLKESLGSGST